MRKILLIGQDNSLLETRAAVLQRTGAAVVSSDLRNTFDLLDSEIPDLVVICHSLPVDDAELMADRVRGRCPGAKILLVLPEAYPDRPYRDSKFDAITVPDPSRLIRSARELMPSLPDKQVEETVLENKLSTLPEAAQHNLKPSAVRGEALPE